MQPTTGIEERQRGPSMSSAAAQSRPEALIRYLLEGTSSQTGQEFFRALVHSVALAMDVAGVWVTEYLPERKVLRFLLPAIPNLLPSVLADGSLAPQPETDT